MDTMNTLLDMPSLQQRLHEYMKMTGNPSDKFKTILQDVTKIKVFMTRINPMEALEKVGRNAFLLVKALAEASFQLIFCPAKGYILVTNTVAALATMVQTVVGMKSKIPKRLQPKVDEINDYLEKIKVTMKKVEDGILKLLEEIDKACRNDFVVSLVEMKGLEGDRSSLECELKICEIELQAAQELLEKLESTVRKRLFELGSFTLAAAFTGGVFSSGAAVVGAACLGFCFLPALSNHSHLLKECEQIKCELRKANLQFRVEKRTVEESLTEEMALLDTSF